MKHAGPQTLATLDALLSELRSLPGLAERKPGIFYRKGRAFLHFHEDPAGVFADARLAGASFERFAVSSPQERGHFVDAVRRALQAGE